MRKEEYIRSWCCKIARSRNTKGLGEPFGFVRKWCVFAMQIKDDQVGELQLARTLQNESYSPALSGAGAAEKSGMPLKQSITVGNR